MAIVISQQFTLPNHRHTTTPQDGGALDATTDYSGAISNDDIASSANIAITKLDSTLEPLLASQSASNGSQSVTVNIPTAKKFYRVELVFEIASSNINDSYRIRFNSDSGNNYSYIEDTGDGTPSSSTADSGIRVNKPSSGTIGHIIMFVENIASGKIKGALIRQSVYSGSSSAPDISIRSACWNNTTSQITSITLVNTGGSGTLSSNTVINVWGHD